MEKRLTTENLQYYVDYDYDTSYSCEDSGCDNEGICRCGSIENAVVNPINISEFAKKMYELYNPPTKDKTILRDRKIKSLFDSSIEEINIYCIDRICRVLKVWDLNKWEVNVCGGYYGDEVDSVKFEDVVKLAEKIEAVLELSSVKEKIEYVLTVEYGSILPELKDKEYSLIEISKDDVIFGSEGQYKKVSTEDLTHYSNKEYSGIRGLLLPKGEKFRLIDGYHRMFATNNKKKIRVLLAQ
jgi:hypothetical protein